MDPSARVWPWQDPVIAQSTCSIRVDCGIGRFASGGPFGAGRLGARFWRAFGGWQEDAYHQADQADEGQDHHGGAQAVIPRPFVELGEARRIGVHAPLTREGRRSLTHRLSRSN
jgi:hypothetical protein